MSPHPLLSIFSQFRSPAIDQRTKGALFEKLIARWLTTDPTYAARFDKVWLWADFANLHGLNPQDLGIDLVAQQRDSGLFTAIQCKFYAEDTTINKSAVDSFITAMSGIYHPNNGDSDPLTFADGIWVSTSDVFGPNARESLATHHQNIVVVNLGTLMQSPVDWKALAEGHAPAPRKPATPFDYQEQIVAKARAHFAAHDRGTLVMACGTGKTLTSLFIAQDLLAASPSRVVLFLAPSIALVAQTLRSWMASARLPIRAACVCSDTSAASTTTPNEDDDTITESLLDLPIPSCTRPEAAAAILSDAPLHDGMTVIFSTYQSIDVVHEAQQLAHTPFDLVICDEAHRTAASILGTDKKSDEKKPSPFARVHDADFIHAARRLYMTATPKVYAQSEKQHAKEADDTLFSMDDETVFGPRFHTLSFGTAVEKGLLTDYKVLVLTVDPMMLSNELLERLRKQGEALADGSESSLRFVVPEMAARMVGAVAAMSKLVTDNASGEANPFADEDEATQHTPLQTAIAFCDVVNRTKRTKGGSFVARETSEALKVVTDSFREELCHKLATSPNDKAQYYASHLADVRSSHVTGAMATNERERNLAIVRSPQKGVANIVCNVNCLSEGVDVPALDAVIFLAAKKSPITLVQSVGRVMRRFAGKRYGYVIIPIICDFNANPEDAIERSEYSRVWDILQAMRSHDERIAAELSSHTYQHVRVVHLNHPHPKSGPRTSHHNSSDYPVLPFSWPPIETTDLLYTKMVERCGDRLYWPLWSSKAGRIAQNFISRIGALLDEGRYVAEMDCFVAQLRECLNPSVTRAQAVEFLAQHLVSRPVFDAIFAAYDIAHNNPVSRAMEQMLQILEDQAFAQDREMLSDFQDNVRQVTHGLNSTAKRQEMIKTLYENFFKAAFPRVAEQLGIVYTPVECVDFIVRSVDHLLRRDFHSSIATPGVRLLDPFAGTGTFTARALAFIDECQDASDEALELKYANDLFCNEIVPLSYYVADVNIETVFNGLPRRANRPYIPFNGISLTDTFELAEPHAQQLLFPDETLTSNTEAARALMDPARGPITVIYGNPPYSVGQRSANDKAKNQSYPDLEKRIANTYAATGDATSKKALYDSYIKAFRWASDRIAANGDAGGIVAFISNGAWIDGNSQAGLRACFAREFHNAYVINLRGNCRTSGELRRQEGDNVFELGSRTPIAITILERLPGEAPSVCNIHYHDIGDYLSREEKLARLSDFASIANVPFTSITPNDRHDWINQRDGTFELLTPLAPMKKYDLGAKSWFVTHSLGIATAKDPFLYNFSKKTLCENVKRMIDFYNEERLRYTASDKSVTPQDFVNRDDTKISWAANFFDYLCRNTAFEYKEAAITESLYRPFDVENFCYDKPLIQRTYQMTSLFPTPTSQNLVICVSGIGDNYFSCLITDRIPDLHAVGSCQCFPLYYYPAPAPRQGNLFNPDAGLDAPERRSAISPYALHSLHAMGINATPEDVFFWVYARLHDSEWRNRYADDLRKSLPRIALPTSPDAFAADAALGRRLADIHLAHSLTPEMEDALAAAGVTVEGRSCPSGHDPFDHFHLPDKMRFPARDDKSQIILSGRVAVRNIPPQAYLYTVNGKSPAEWVMERLAVRQDKKTSIINDPNLWAREHNQPDYILTTLLRAIATSLLTLNLLKK
ncbi:MAG: DEAD/DEAH box helicase family protein [Bacteroidales bacterium]|nr:DEAD/DEAH box helicase family protein [Bacteroidales bacterium]